MIDKAARARQNGQRPRVVWLTGLSASGKSTLAQALQVSLFETGRRCYLLDGDALRAGLNRDLGFGDADRRENIRRVGELSKLLLDAGLIVIAAFISPFREDRDRVRALLAPGEFLEVYLDVSLAVCESRDPKGLYRRARAGEITHFTGIDSRYEPPLAPDLALQTDKLGVGECIEQILQLLSEPQAAAICRIASKVQDIEL